jgi:lysophospholipase L1-like esterase
MLICVLLLQSCTAAEDKSKEVHYTIQKYPFIHSERNEIIHAEVMDSFFEQLYLLRSGQPIKVNVLQIGDSHIQADFLSAAVRTDFQTNFGNAGRGLVVPLHVAGTNESFNYRITSNVVCTSKRCVFVNDPMPIGIGGVTIRSFSDNTSFRIRAFNAPPINYAFNKVTLFYQKDSSAFDFDVLDTAGRIIGSMHHALEDSYSFSSRVDLPFKTNDISLRVKKLSDTQNETTVYGLNLENDSSGVLYHSVGVNGAEAFQYVRAQFFAEQTQALNPSLIIISLGTNEAQRLPFDKVGTIAKLDSLIRVLRTYNPKAAILLTTPSDSYFRKKYYNNSLALLHEAMVNYAKENHVAIWDLYSIGGGYKSCYQWKRYGLMRADGIHFGKQGYEFQGNLMYESIIAAYNKYVQSKTNQK